MEALAGVIDPALGKNVIEAGMVSSIVIRGDGVGFSLEVPAHNAGEKEPLRKACEQAVKRLAGVARVTVVLTAQLAGEAPIPKRREEKKIAAPIPGVKMIIAVASGKGGVGKSTTAVNLAVLLHQQGVKVGVVDADIYGPSIPHMMGINQQPEVKGNKMVPLEQYGVKFASIGAILPEGAAAIWRGPMATKALYQLMRGTEWGELDILLVDMPPGTGDIHLSLIEHYPVAGVIIVSTPQHVALLDVEKAVNMLEKVQVPVLGVIENMSYYQASETGEKHYLFGKDGAKKLASHLNVPFLGEVPIEIAIREGGDAGHPFMAERHNATADESYRHIMDVLLQHIKHLHVVSSIG